MTYSKVESKYTGVAGDEICRVQTKGKEKRGLRLSTSGMETTPNDDDVRS